MEDFWTWYKSDGLDANLDPIMEEDLCENFEKELLFELGESMWRRHQSIF